MYWETVSNDTFRICQLVQRFRDLVELPECMTVYTPDNCLHPGQLFTPRTTVYTPDNCYVVSKINVAVSFDIGHVLAVRRVA